MLTKAEGFDDIGRYRRRARTSLGACGYLGSRLDRVLLLHMERRQIDRQSKPFQSVRLSVAHAQDASLNCEIYSGI